MQCHATGQKPSREYPRAKFVMLLTPLGALRFRDKETVEWWVETLSPEMRQALAQHDVRQTPGTMIAGPPV